MARALAASGFDVQLGADLDRKGLETALQEFAHDAMQADVAMVYFAGHGLEASGANWLLPVDVNIRSFTDVPATAVPFEMVARSLAGASVKIVALDACRDNPFAARLASASGVDLSSLTLAGKMPWEPQPCFKGEVAWGVADPASDRFVAQVTTLNRGTLDRSMTSNVKELLLASYRSRELVCRVVGAANDAAFGTDGDLYTAHDGGTIVRHDRNCRAKQTYRLHRGAVEQILAITGGRMLSRSVDGAVKLWSPATAQSEKEVSGLARQAQILDAAEDGSAVLILNEDRRLYIWYGEPRLGPYIGPSGPVCAGALSADTDVVYALKCEGNAELWRRQRLD